ncbi:glycoside hydrolase family 16 protein [Plicaturopsis crispa FD-325 SS-3]|nr:glycoside hydrolase family 16 protein [Plicaturopsis crispa FD-325 SS-3]
MGGGAATSSPTNSVYSSSAAAGIQRHASSTGLNESGNLPRNSSQTFRAPFLSPASRPSSSLWSPPSYAGFSGAGGPPSPHLSPSVSTSALALALPKPKAPLPSTRLPEKLGKEDKPWLVKKDKHTKIGWWLTFSMILLGLCGAGALAWSGTRNVFVIKDSQLCLVMQDDFDTLDLTNNWSKDIELGGFGNGEFQMTTDSSDNMYINDGQLYIVPTLTSDTLGTDAIFNGGNYTLDNCSTDNSTACSVSSSSDTDTVINPVMSGRLNTKGKVTLQYGKVEIRAKLPTGDWLWPAIWMLPEDNEYGEWPMSGEMDIMEARGNKPSAQGQGTNFVRSSLNYGPLDSLTHTIFGWYSLKRTTLAQGFHTYSVEWTGDFMRFYTDSRLNAMLDLRTRNEKESFWNQAGFPETAQNGSSKVVINNIYSGGANSAPFDKSFYLLIDLAVGGTSGWFPDGVDGKPWYDASSTAMHDFAKAQDTWHATWPSNVNDLAFRIDYVKMWKLC